MHVVWPKNDAENIFPQFFAIFAPFKLQKALIFGIFILEMSSKWLLDAFNINVTYFEHKRFIFILIFWDFFANIKRYPKF